MHDKNHHTINYNETGYDLIVEGDFGIIPIWPSTRGSVCSQYTTHYVTFWSSNNQVRERKNLRTRNERKKYRLEDAADRCNDHQQQQKQQQQQTSELSSSSSSSSSSSLSLSLSLSLLSSSSSEIETDFVSFIWFTINNNEPYLCYNSSSIIE